jgi:protein involved in polysaccharide export with SLBB domain
MAKYFAWGSIFAIGLQCAGCAANLGPVIIEEPEVSAHLTASTHLQRGDRIKVTVYGEDALGGIYDVDAGGFVSLPLAGTIRAAGRTRAELERVITAKYKSEYLQNPKVTVDYAGYRPFYVLGEAEHPGEFPYRPGITLLDAITTAGGMSYRASRTYVRIKHAGEDEWREYPLSSAIYVAVLPGDTIRVPERYF